MSAQTETKSGKTMRIKDVRQELYTLVHTQGVDGLLHLYQRLEKRNRALLLCLLCAEAGRLILVNAWLRLERAYLKLRLFCECNSRNSQEQKWEVRDALQRHSDRGTPPDEATPDGNDSLYCFNFLTQREDSHEWASRTSTAADVAGDPGENVGVDVRRLAHACPGPGQQQPLGQPQHDGRPLDRCKQRVSLGGNLFDEERALLISVAICPSRSPSMDACNARRS